MIANTCWVYFESSSHEPRSVWFECLECLWVSGRSCDWTASSLAGWLRPLRRRSAAQDGPSVTSLIIQRPLGPFERAAISLKNSPRSTPTWWSSITPAPPHPPALLHTSTMSTAAQGVLQITSYDTTVWNTESTGTQFSILIHFTYLVQFRQSHCSFFPFYMMAACFHEDTIPVCDGRTGLVCTERQPQLYQTRQLIAEQRHQTSSTGCMEANPRWRRKKARVQSPPRQSINQSNTLLIPDGTIHSKQGQQDIKQLTHRQQTDEANLHWRHSDIEAAALLGTLFHSFITAEKNPRMFYGNM